MESRLYRTKRMVTSALMIAVGTILSLFEFRGFWVYGGGVTFCSMLPLVIISYRYGNRWGVFTALVYSLLQMVLGLKNVMYAPNAVTAGAVILLDYVLAFTCIGFAGAFRGVVRGQAKSLLIGILVTFSARFICHFLSGWLIWDALWPNEMGMASAVYSLVYNASYMIPEILITAVVTWILSHIIRFDRM